MTRALIIPAAGIGSRLGHAGPKALYPLAGRPLLDYLIDLYRDDVDRIVLVVRPADREVFTRHLLAFDGAARHLPHTLIDQAEPTGMLDAILLAREALSMRRPDRVWITWCDQVAISHQTVARMRELEWPHPIGAGAGHAAALVFPTVEGPEPYIHIERGEDTRITKILHRREGDAMPAVGESDAGLFSLSREAFFELLPRYAESVAVGAVGAATRERNFLPFIPWLSARAPSADAVRTFPCASAIEAIGVNTPEDAAILTQHLHFRDR